MSAGALVPFRWPSAWNNPALLDLVARSPINCLLLDASGGTNPIADAARNAGLTLLDWGSLRAAPLAEIKWDSPVPQCVITDLVWPRMKMSPRGQRDDSQTGPTGAPWIDSNSWVARLAAVRAPGKPVWLSFEPSPKDPAPEEAGYTIAIADSAAPGARWIVSLDESLVKGLPAGDAEALKQWRAILAALSFFEQHRDWSAWEPWGPIGILSTFAGKDEYLGQEVLNLAARRNLLYRVLDRSIPASQKVEGLRAVLYVDNDPPNPQLKERLTAFARAGGLLIVPRALNAQFPAARPLRCPVAGYELGSFGKGTLAAGTADWDDPFFLAADVHSLVSRRNDPVRLFNGRSLWAHYSVPGSGGAALLQLVSFTSRPNGSVSVASEHPWRSATMYAVGSETPTVLEPRKVDGLTEFNLPPLSYYAAVEFRA